MKTFYALLILLLISFTAKAQNTSIDSIVSVTKEKYAPDRRVSIFDVSQTEKNGQYVLKGRISDSNAHKYLLKTLNDKKMRVLDSIQLLPETTIGKEHWSVVPFSVIYIYSRPNFGSEVVTQALMGMPVRVLDRDRDWLLIQTPDKYIGWTSTRMKLMDREELSAYNGLKKVIVTSLSSVIYEGKSDKSQSIMEVLIGNILTLDDKRIKGKFSKIMLPNGTKGYVSSRSIRELNDWYESIPMTGENVVRMGKQFLGLPYFWGGTSSRGFDCSGFTKTVYYMYGQILPRDASQQFYVGEIIEPGENYENLKEGDLLFFGSRGNQSGKKQSVEHVGIYLGGLKFMHAAQLVRINSLDPKADNYEGFYVKRLLGVRRIIGDASVQENNILNNEWYK